VAVVVCGGEVSADLISLRRVEIDVESEGFPPVPEGRGGVICGLVAAGEAVVGASLLVFVTEMAGQGERGGVLCTGVAGLAGGEKKLAQADECLGLPGRVAGFAKQRQGLAEMARRMLVALPSQFGDAQVTERVSFAVPVARFAEQGQDLLGVLVPGGHRFTALDGVPVAALADEPLLLAEDLQAPEFNQFVVELCRSAGFTPTVYRGTVESIRAAADLVVEGRCLCCVPASCIPALPGAFWRPLTEPACWYPWSILWRAADDSEHVRAVVTCARQMSQRLGWMAVAARVAG
jgi:LysR substrate binding domain